MIVEIQEWDLEEEFASTFDRNGEGKSPQHPWGRNHSYSCVQARTHRGQLDPGWWNHDPGRGTHSHRSSSGSHHAIRGQIVCQVKIVTSLTILRLQDHRNNDT
jgi:hypothetical protein